MYQNKTNESDQTNTLRFSHYQQLAKKHMSKKYYLLCSILERHSGYSQTRVEGF